MNSGELGAVMDYIGRNAGVQVHCGVMAGIRRMAPSMTAYDDDVVEEIVHRAEALREASE